MRKILTLTATLLITGCQGGAMPIDGQKFLSSLEGPKVPTVQDSMLEAAKAAEAQGHFQQAAQLYRQVLEKRPDDKEVLLPLADAYRRAGDNDRAMAVYDMLLKKDAGNAGAKEGKALTLMAKGDYDTPAALFQEVMKEEPGRWKTLNALGILFTMRGMQPEAQQYFEAALKSRPGSATVMNNLGLSQALGRDNESAVATLLKASSLSEEASQRKRIDLNLALVYAIEGKVDDARAIASNYYSGAALDNNIGLYAHLAKDDKLARTYLNMALSESKVFYERAWDNLQALGTEQGSNSLNSEEVNKRGRKEKEQAEKAEKAEKTDAVVMEPAAEEPGKPVVVKSARKPKPKPVAARPEAPAADAGTPASAFDSAITGGKTR